MPGDTINFVASDKGHQVYSVPGMIPEGAEPFDAKMSADIKVTFTVSGVYVIACRPQMIMAMIGVVVVGNPMNINTLDPSSLSAKARTNSIPCSNPSRTLSRAKGPAAAS